MSPFATCDNPRQASDSKKRWLEVLDHYNFQIKPVPGPMNVVADSLSRTYENHEPRTEACADLLERVQFKALPHLPSEAEKTKEPKKT